MTRSGLQRQVLTLYKEFLIVIKEKPKVCTLHCYNTIANTMDEALATPLQGLYSGIVPRECRKSTKKRLWDD